MRYSFDVVGEIAPQGSKTTGRRANGTTFVRESSQKVKPWRADVIAVARELVQGEPLDGPLKVHVIFRKAMPASRKKADRERGWMYCSVTPDIDKVLRATLDALKQAGMIADDARVCWVAMHKIEVVGWTGASITVENMPELGDTHGTAADQRPVPAHRG